MKPYESLMRVKQQISKMEADIGQLTAQVDVLDQQVDDLTLAVNQLHGSVARLRAAQTTWCLQYRLAEKVLSKFPDKWGRFLKTTCGALKKDKLDPTKQEIIITRVRFDLLVDFIEGDGALEQTLDDLIAPLAPEEEKYTERVKVISSRFRDLTATIRVDFGYPCADEKSTLFTTEHLVSVVAQADFEVDVLNETIVAVAKLLGALTPSSSIEPVNLLFRYARL